MTFGYAVTEMYPFLMFPLVCQLLRKCILNMSKPSVEGPLGNPPFEKPSIAKVTVYDFIDAHVIKSIAVTVM